MFKKKTLDGGLNSHTSNYRIQYVLNVWQHDGLVVIAAASQYEGPGFKSRVGPFCVKCARSPRVAWVFSGFLSQSKNIHV